MRTRKPGIARCIALVALATAVVVGPASRAMAADEHVIGTITARLGSGFVMHTYEGTPVKVALTEATKLKVDDGPGTWEASQLVPGLRVKVEGLYDGEMNLVAEEIKFSESDRKLALAIKAGLAPTAEQVQRNVADLEQHGRSLGEHQQTLGLHGRDLTDHDQRIVATTGAIANTNVRIGRLDDYNAVDTFTVYFGNGQARLRPQELARLDEFANRAKGVEGYVLQVEGFASAVGARAVNDELSHRRAEAVIAALQQRAGIPSANLFVPAAMGTSVQVAENKTAKGQAQNRRVVVTVLQNKGIADKY